MMKQCSYLLKFVTPAFLGDAEQKGVWRTPPIKALLRQWWRVAWAGAKGHPVSVNEMRKAEADLFGSAADSKTSHKSLVRIRLSRWDEGQIKRWEPLAKVTHPNVNFPIASDLYMGYGPLVLPKGERAHVLKANAAIQADEHAILSLAFPAGDEAALHAALQLMNLYGTLGGRGRNGWGSCTLTPADEATPALDGPLDPKHTRPWKDALALDWPHAVGLDGASRPLVWRTREAFPDWKVAMVELAKRKIALRTRFTFTTGKNAPRPEARHWLSYPVTNHSVSAWGGNARLPNSLRFKLRPDSDGTVRGVIFHVPCLPTEMFQPDRAAVMDVWSKVHAHLDEQPTLERSTK